MARETITDKNTDSRKIDDKLYSLLYKNPNPNGSDVYAYVFPSESMKRASDAGTTAPASHVARLVPWNVILPSRDQVKSWISPVDIAVHNSYVPVDVLRSFSKLITTLSTLLTKGVSSDLIMEVVAAALAEAEGS